MKFGRGIISVILIVFVCSCSSNKPGGTFLKDGVSFTYPSGWSITEEEEIDGGGYYLSVEKAGFEASGIVTITWINNIIDSHDYLQLLQEEYENQKMLKELEFQPAREAKFNGIQCIASELNFKTLGVAHRGIMYVFTSGEKSYSIIRQEAIEDISKNKDGFDLIESTFKIQ